MIAASVKDGEKVVDLLLSRGADVNQTSKSHPQRTFVSVLTHIGSQQRPGRISEQESSLSSRD